jgi:DNA repair protein RadC
MTVHNDTPGDPTPSRIHIQMTEAFINVTRSGGITVRDHITIGKDGHASLKVRLILGWPCQFSRQERTSFALYEALSL